MVNSRRRAQALAVLVPGIGLGGAVAIMVAEQAAHSHPPLPGLIPMAAMAAVGILLATRLPSNPVGWLTIAGSLEFGCLIAGAGNVPFAPRWLLGQSGAVETVGFATAIPTLLILLPLVFPDGRLLSRRWRIVVWLTTAATLLSLGNSLFNAVESGSLLDSISSWSGPLTELFLLLLIVAAMVSLVVRYRRAQSELRHQLKWFVAAIAFAGLAVIPAFLGASDFLSALGLLFVVMAISTGIAIAVLKYRLYDIDVIISRALVYGTLAAFITAVYVGIVVGVGTLVGGGGQPNLLLSIVATAVVAVAFQPVRERLQRIANRLVYGKRATPYEVLSQFSERVAETYGAEEALPRMARVLAEGTGAERAQVWLRAGTLLRPTAAWPEAGGAEEPVPVSGDDLPELPGEHAVPVRHQGEVLGALTVTKRQGESLTPIEQKLLDDLAHQAGLVLKNVGLTAELRARLEDLRASRQRLVAAQDEERRRLERNLHDGAQQNLVAIKVKLGMADALADKDPAKARELVGQLKADTDEALETLRDLARGIYPPLLADRGLKAALESQARKATLPVEVEANGLGRYPQEIEAAVYFCCLEALQNVQKYAEAEGAVLKLSGSVGSLLFEVADNGKGFEVALTTRGAGLTNMTDRIDALGGLIQMSSTPGRGTRIHGSLPVAPAVATAWSSKSPPKGDG
jgi:signal transduction histidine kinase